MNKILSLFVSFIIFITVLSITVSAGELTGKCGDNVIWSYDESTNTLTISGEGEMYDYELEQDIDDNSYAYTPWFNYKVSFIVIDDRITKIGDYAFFNCSFLEKIKISTNVKHIGKFALPTLITVTYLGTQEQWRSLEKDSNYGFISYHRVFCRDGVLLPSGLCGENLTWMFDDITGEFSITGTGDMYDYSHAWYEDDVRPWWQFTNLISTVYVEETVTSIGDLAFSGCHALEEVVMNGKLTTIGNSAFEDCSSLTSFAMPDTLISIGNYAFAYCYSLNDFIIPDSLTSIGEYAFTFCNALTNLDIPDNLLEIGQDAFYSCDGLESVVIGDGLVIVSENAFGDCDNLKRVVLGSSVSVIERGALSNCEKFSSLTMCNSVKKIERFAFSPNIVPATSMNIEYLGTKEDLQTVVVERVDYENNKFYNAEFHFENGEIGGLCGEHVVWCLDEQTKSITISGTGDMYDYAFNLPPIWIDASYGIKKINDGITRIGDYAFSGSTMLNEIVIPDSVESIGSFAFEDCDKLIKVNIPSSVLAIESYAFYGCSMLEEVIISDGVESIGAHAFGYCKKLAKVNIPDSVLTIGLSAFDSCTSLRGIIIGDGVKNIGDNAFNDCSRLKTVIIGDSVETIGVYAFFGCRNLTNVVIGNGIRKIDSHALGGFRKLSDVYYVGSEAQWDSVSIHMHNSELLNAKIHYNCQKTGEIPPTCTEEGYVTYNCSCCDVDYVFEYIEPIAHNYVGAEIPATCTTHGYTNYTCDDCGKSYVDYTANPTGHTFSEDGVCEFCGEKEITTTPVNTQMLTIDSVLAMVMNLLAKLFSAFSVA